MEKGKLQKIIALVEKVELPKNIDISSPLVSLSLRHFKYDLNSTTAPLLWDIEANNENKTVKITIKIDKRAMEEDAEIKEYVLKSIKDNKNFSELVHALQQFEPNNAQVKNLYNLSTWEKKESTNQVIYTNTIKY